MEKTRSADALVSGSTSNVIVVTAERGVNVTSRTRQQVKAATESERERKRESKFTALILIFHSWVLMYFPVSERVSSKHTHSECCTDVCFLSSFTSVLITHGLLPHHSKLPRHSAYVINDVSM